MWRFQREVSHSLLFLCCWWRDELHDPGAWLISDHYPISAPLSGWCAFVLAFISIASYTTSRLGRDCGAWECACRRGLAETVRFCDHARFFYFSVALFSVRSGWRGENEEGREEGNVQWGDSQGVIRLLSDGGVSGSVNALELKSSSFIKK